MHKKFLNLFLALMLLLCGVSPAMASSYGFPQKAEDAASANGDNLIQMGGVRKDVPDTTTTSADGDVSQLSTDKRGILLVNQESSCKATFGATTGFFTCAASATDFFTLYGSASKTIKIVKINLQNMSTGTSAVFDTISLIKRSTAPTPGTATDLTAVPLDSNNTASTVDSGNTIKNWTANPTVGSSIGTIATYKCTGMITGATGNTNAPNYNTHVIYDAEKAGTQQITLRGTSEGIALSLGGSTQAGTSPTMCVNVVWTEESLAGMVAFILMLLCGGFMLPFRKQHMEVL